MTEFNYVSLFSGIGGFEQALNKIGGNCVMASEIDKFAEKAYQTLYGHETVGDVTKVDAKDVPEHDLLVGGFPCQAFSVAGKRGGFEDARGTLFFEVARIAKEKQPKALLLENVKGLVGHDKGKTLDTIVKTLNDIGYRVDFEVLNSKFFGVPQNRERIFIVAVREDLVDNEAWTNVKGATVVPKGKRRIGEWAKTFNFDFPEQKEVTTRLRDILESNVDEKYYLDEEKTAKLVAKLNKENRRIFNEVDKERIIQLNGDRGQLLQEPQMLGHVDIKGNDSIKRVYSPDGINPTLTTMGGGHREPKIAEERTPVQYNRKSGIGRELEQANTLSARDWRGLNRNQNQNAVLEEVRPVLTPDRMEKRQDGRRFKEDGEEAHTVTSQDRHGVAIGDTTRYRIRKLTPLECWRLQGFSDEAHEAVKQAGLSDSQRYKQAGNAVTVNVIEAISEKLTPYFSA